MTPFDHPLARRTVIKGAGLGLGAGVVAGLTVPHGTKRKRRAVGRRRDLEQRILGQKGRRAAVDVSQAARRAQGR